MLIRNISGSSLQNGLKLWDMLENQIWLGTWGNSSRTNENWRSYGDFRVDTNSRGGRLRYGWSKKKSQKKNFFQKKKFFSKKRFCFQKKWWISKKLPFLPFLRVFKAFNIAIMSQNEPKWAKNGREPLQNFFFRKRCARHGRSCWAIF